MTVKSQFQFLSKYLKKERAKLIVAFILLLLSSVVEIIYGHVVGSATEAITNNNLSLFLTYLISFGVIGIFDNLVTHRYGKLLLYQASNNITQKLSEEAYIKTMALPATAYEEKTSGEIINRITSDTDVITNLLQNIIFTIISFLGSFAILIYIVANSWIVFLDIIIYVVIIYFITKKKMPIIKNYQEKIKKENDIYTSKVNQAVLGTREIKALGIKKQVTHKITTLIQSVFQKVKNQTDVKTTYYHMISALNGLFELSIFLITGLQIYYGQVTITFFIAMTYYLYRYMNLVTMATELVTDYQKFSVSISRVSELINNKDYQDEQYGNIHDDNIKGNVTFKDVTFHYPNEDIILNHFNLDIPHNQKVAIVGKSGSGKTTLFNLLLRFFDATSGTIYIDDYPIEDLDEETLRKTISVIRQEPFIFNQTIKENLLLVDPHLTDEDMRKYCRLAQIDDYIESLKNGYDTIIGEGGVNLSGGQKQRLAIARALIKESKIILFDEATSALDNISQAKIKEAINTLAKNHTIIMIAHRLSTIIDADTIYFIDKGKIIARGTHQELIKNCRPYQELYEQEEQKST